MNKLKTSYILDQSDNLTQVIVRLQLAVIGSQLRVYVALIKRNEEDFMIVQANDHI